MKDLVMNDDNQLAGNWYPFPPPAPGFYDLRQTHQPAPTSLLSGLHFQYLPNRRVYDSTSKRLLCMGRRVTRMRAEDGWQFRFLQQLDDGVPVNWRPMAVIYDLSDPTKPRVVEKRDISNQLPFARSREEALYIVRLIPDRWPVFRMIHVEYTEEKVNA